jgi:hypothetical protein
MNKKKKKKKKKKMIWMAVSRLVIKLFFSWKKKKKKRRTSGQREKAMWKQAHTVSRANTRAVGGRKVSSQSLQMGWPGGGLEFGHLASRTTREQVPSIFDLCNLFWQPRNHE